MLAVVFVDEINESEKISKEISATLKNGIVGAMPVVRMIFHNYLHDRLGTPETKQLSFHAHDNSG